MIKALRKVIKRVHYPLEVMLTCVHWYLAYPCLYFCRANSLRRVCY